jgi:hypothetical protein
VRRLVALVALALTAGCAQVNALKTKAPDPGTREGEWAARRNQATRRASLYDRFEHRATATVTYLSADVRDARARRLGEWLGWTKEELDRHLAAEDAEAARFEDFVISFYTTDRHANDLDSTQSVWRVALDLGDGSELVTHDVTTVESNTTILHLFPYVGVFDVVYRLRFDRAPGSPLSSRPFQLELGSAMGKMEVAFKEGEVGPDKSLERLQDNE